MRAFISAAVIVVSALSFSSVSFAQTHGTSKKAQPAVENTKTVPAEHKTPVEAPKSEKVTTAKPADAKATTMKHKKKKAAKAETTEKKTHE